MPTSTEQIAELIRSNTELKSYFEGVRGAIDRKVADADKRVDGFIAGARGEQTHVRVTKNQELKPNSAGSFPEFWSGGYTKRATLLEKVSTGVEPTQRSRLAREFLRALNSDTKYFAGSFYIWELEIYPNRATNGQPDVYSYTMFQYVRAAQTCTQGAVVKHIRGLVPYSHWCTGLKANEEAKVCMSHVKWGTNTDRNRYTHCHPYVNGKNLSSTETSVIQVALPGVVTGLVPSGSGWGQFPYLGNADIHAFG